MEKTTANKRSLINRLLAEIPQLVGMLLLIPLLAACGTQPKAANLEVTPAAEIPVQADLPPILVPQTQMYFSPTEGYRYQSNGLLPKIASEDLYAKWAVNMFQLEFRPDGNYILSWKADEFNELRKETGTFFLDYNVITFHPKRFQVGKESPDFELYKGCSGGGSYAYTALFPEDDTRFLHLMLKSPDFCAFRIYKWYAYPVWQRMEK